MLVLQDPQSVCLLLSPPASQTGLGSGPETVGRPCGDKRESGRGKVTEAPGQSNNSVPHSSRSSCCASPLLCTCAADRLPEGPLGSEPPLARTAVCRRCTLVSVIKNEHASLHPERRCYHLGRGATAVCWLCGCPAVWPGMEGQGGLGSSQGKQGGLGCLTPVRQRVRGCDGVEQASYLSGSVVYVDV